jgi:hypothetical protein
MSRSNGSKPQASTQVHYVKDVRRNKDTRDWDAYVSIAGSEPQYLGSRRRSWEAETLCDTYVLDLAQAGELPADVPLTPNEDVILDWILHHATMGPEEKIIRAADYLLNDRKPTLMDAVLDYVSDLEIATEIDRALAA